MNIKIYSDQTLFHTLGSDRVRKAAVPAEERRSIAARRHAKLPSGTSALGFRPHPQPESKLRQYRLRERPRNNQVAVLAMISAVPANVGPAIGQVNVPRILAAVGGDIVHS
jgi:hypothetical protein